MYKFMQNCKYNECIKTVLEIHTLLCDFVKMQEESYEELKNFL